MQQECKKLQNNDLTREELLPHMKIGKMSHNDVPYILNMLVDAFHIPNIREAFMQLIYTNTDIDNSVKLFDERDNKIYGILLFSHHKISNGSPLMNFSWNLGLFLNMYTQIHGFAFLIDERLRGTNLDKEMLFYNEEFIKQYDFIWCAVESNLKTHNYWKRLGFTELLAIDDAKFYIRLSNKSKLVDIYKKIQLLK